VAHQVNTTSPRTVLGGIEPHGASDLQQERQGEKPPGIRLTVATTDAWRPFSGLGKPHERDRAQPPLHRGSGEGRRASVAPPRAVILVGVGPLGTINAKEVKGMASRRRSKTSTAFPDGCSR